jgi:hypothetical protein
LRFAATSLKHPSNWFATCKACVSLQDAGENTMPKRATRKPANDKERSQRKHPYRSTMVAGLVDRIRDQAARLSGLARTMDDAKVGEVVVDGHAMLLRGLNQIDNFIDNASRSVREARTRSAQE